MHKSGSSRLSKPPSAATYKLLIGKHQVYEGFALSGNIPHGMGSVIFSNGDMMISEFMNGTPCGECLVLNQKGAFRAKRGSSGTVPMEIRGCLTSIGGVLLTHQKTQFESEYIVCNLRDKVGSLVQMALSNPTEPNGLQEEPSESHNAAGKVGIDVQVEPLEKLGICCSEVENLLWRSIFAPLPGRGVSQTDHGGSLLHDHTSATHFVGLHPHSSLGGVLSLDPHYMFSAGTPITLGGSRASVPAGMYLGSHTPLGGTFFSHIPRSDQSPTDDHPPRQLSYTGGTALIPNSSSKSSIQQSSAEFNMRLGSLSLVPHGEGVVRHSSTSGSPVGHTSCSIGLWKNGVCLSSREVSNTIPFKKLVDGVVLRMHNETRKVDRLGVDIPHSSASKITEEATRILKYWIQPASGISLITKTCHKPEHPDEERMDKQVEGDGEVWGPNHQIYGQRQVGEEVEGNELAAPRDGLGWYGQQIGGRESIKRVESDRIIVDWGHGGSTQLADLQLVSSNFSGRDSPPFDEVLQDKDHALASVFNAHRLNTINETPGEEDFCKSKRSLTPSSNEPSPDIRREAHRDLLGHDSGRSTAPRAPLQLQEWILGREQKLAWAIKKCSTLDHLSSQIEWQISQSKKAQ